jgi:alginate O-acetyltransferase complex protein AlgJ
MALVEVGHTTVSAATAAVLLAVFLAVIGAAPAVDVAMAVRRESNGARAAWSQLGRLPHLVRDAARSPAAGRSWRQIVAGNRVALGELRAFEDALDEGSVIGRAMRVPSQFVMSAWLGAGSERVYQGRRGWLFYRPDVDYVTGPGFLDTAQMTRRRAAAKEWAAPPSPDPRPAIVGFHRDLAARGIALIVVPTPVKPTVHPERLSGRRLAAPVENPSYRRWLRDVRREGVVVCDLAPALAEGRGAGAAYLATDTHWRPESMELAAEVVAACITGQTALPPVEPPGYRVETAEVRQAGDLALMLDLPRARMAFPKETVWIRRVLGPDGSPWRPSPGADVIVLGDSFANIYSLASMGWGDAAGFAEHLSLVLQRPIDRLVRNDEGAFVTRELLAGNPGRLAGTRAVVYQFATRELALGDWRVVDLERPGPR